MSCSSSRSVLPYVATHTCLASWHLRQALDVSSRRILLPPSYTFSMCQKVSLGLK
jgi:hypothetical protein